MTEVDATACADAYPGLRERDEPGARATWLGARKDRSKTTLTKYVQNTA